MSGLHGVNAWGVGPGSSGTCREGRVRSLCGAGSGGGVVMLAEVLAGQL